MRIPILIIGSIILLVGIVSLVTPMRGGTLLIAAGAGMVLCTSDAANRYLTKCRAKYDRLNRAVGWLENKMGDRLGAPLKATRPNKD